MGSAGRMAGPIAVVIVVVEIVVSVAASTLDSVLAAGMADLAVADTADSFAVGFDSPAAGDAGPDPAYPCRICYYQRPD